MKKILLPIAMISSGLLTTGMVHAATATTTLEVNAIVGTACSVSTTPVDFGFVGPFGGVWASGGVTTVCTPGTPINIALDAGLNFDGIREMSDGLGNLMPYILYNPDIGWIWGDDGNTIPEASLATISSSTGADVFTVDAEIPPLGLPVTDGFYSDVVNVTVSY